PVLALRNCLRSRGKSGSDGGFAMKSTCDGSNETFLDGGVKSILIPGGTSLDGGPKPILISGGVQSKPRPSKLELSGIDGSD
nr:hypothetical protein [Tanacetum cinerariifolium]